MMVDILPSQPDSFTSTREEGVRVTGGYSTREAVADGSGLLSSSEHISQESDLLVDIP